MGLATQTSLSGEEHSRDTGHMLVVFLGGFGEELDVAHYEGVVGLLQLISSVDLGGCV